MIRHTGFRMKKYGIIFRNYSVFFLLMMLALHLLVSCSSAQVQKSPSKGIYHIVKKGETAYGIARAYSIRLQDLAEINNIRDVSSLKEGSVIFIPDANQVIDDVTSRTGKTNAGVKQDAGLTAEKPSDPIDAARPAEKLPQQINITKPTDKPQTMGDKPHREQNPPKQSGFIPTERKDHEIAGKQPLVEKKNEIKPEKGGFVWPVRGTVKTHFGLQPNKTYHNWIKITCPEGTKVKAAAGGTVIFSANLKDFGETIIIRHANDLATVYTHLKKRYAQADQTVKKGSSIALGGEKDNLGDEFINFEIRFKGKAHNPLLYLP